MRSYFERLGHAAAVRIAPAMGIQTDSDAFAVLGFGMTALFISVPKTLVLLALALLLGIWKEVLVFVAAYGLLRHFSFGAHMPHPVLCAAQGFLYFLSAPYIARYTVIHPAVMALLWGLCFILVWRYAPAQTRKNPLAGSVKKKNRVYSVTVLALLFAAAAFLYIYRLSLYARLLLLAAALQTVNLLPPVLKRLDN